MNDEKPGGMKKILFLVLIFYPIALFSQPASGDGTSGNPYSGIITTPWTLTGNQFCGDLIVSSGTFTINAGATLQFGSVNSLTISGTVVLSANGINSSSYITFTASGSSWGHIYFDNATAIDNSIVYYCIIENGDARNLSPAFGGGIHANTSKLVISNSLIQNNKAVWGGGILVNQSMNQMKEEEVCTYGITQHLQSIIAFLKATNVLPLPLKFIQVEGCQHSHNVALIS